MAKTLKDYFPMIRTRKEVLKEIGNKEKLWNIFELWKEEQQEEDVYKRQLMIRMD